MQLIIPSAESGIGWRGPILDAFFRVLPYLPEGPTARALRHMPQWAKARR
jgi:hypothetical protein